PQRVVRQAPPGPEGPGYLPKPPEGGSPVPSTSTLWLVLQRLLPRRGIRTTLSPLQGASAGSPVLQGRAVPAGRLESQPQRHAARRSAVNDRAVDHAFAGTSKPLRYSRVNSALA